MANSYYSGQLEFGAGFFGLRFSGTADGYYTESKIPVEWRVIKKPLVGFIYSENAVNNKDAVMDFTRINDREVTPNTPIISAPEYSYDIFSIQGEGTGGSIRAYRDDLGFMKDNITTSKDNSFTLGADIAPGGHYGGNITTTHAPTKAGSWDDANNTLSQTMVFGNRQSDSLFERVYFKNPGECTVARSNMLTRIGGDNLVRFKLDGSNVTPHLVSSLEVFDKNTGTYKTDLPVSNSNIIDPVREKRTQITSILTAADAANIGLEKYIRNYTGTFDINNNLEYDSIARVGGYRKKHHISEIDVLEANGMRYVYGLPVYNTVQKDFTFSVGSLPVSTADNLVNFSTNEADINNSPYLSNGSDIDGYIQSQETPAYASSFLITGLLSPDYIDVTGNGITEDDLGSAVKFDYTKSTDLYKWRTPRNNASGQAVQAHFNEGIRTEKKDNKATISYGEREAWYLKAIESKSMIAIFKTEARNDSRGVKGEFDGSIDTTKNANRKLTRIDLYTKAEIKAKGITLARPVKSVFFVYDSSLCMGTPDSKNGGGKLTLKSVYFTYNGQSRTAKDKYVFDYGNPASSSDNPSYAYSAADRWGTFKDPADATVHPGGLPNMDYPYTDTSKVKDDQFAGAWSLKKILLPSGGQMEIQYEADDYAYVQNRRACNMFSIYGLGTTTDYSNNNSLYNSGTSTADNNYVYVHLAQPLTSGTTADLKKEIYSKYLEGLNQLAFKLQVNMPDGAEPLTAYAEFEDYGVCTNSGSKDYIYIKLKQLDGKSPLAKSAIGFLTESLPEQAFPGYKAEVNSVTDFLGLVAGMLTSLTTAFQNVDQQMRSAAKAKNIVLSKSFVRLDNPLKMKYGGGYRVKRILVKDNWKHMTQRGSNPGGEYTSTYGQDYDYTTTEKINGEDKVISSGVASYEPGIGSEENPFREILQFSNKLPLASAQYGAIEMPMLDALYPSPMVGYSKVTVRSIHRKGTHGDSSLRSAIGKQVTEFYTSKDYPVHSTYTPMNSVEYNKNPFFSFLYKEIINRRTISQGFLVETNDMNGKMRSQASYSESDEKTPLSASYHTYKNTGKNGLNDQVDFVYNGEGGKIRKGNMGIDMELMTDVREFKLESNNVNFQGQVDIFSLPCPVCVIIPTMYALNTYQENLYRAVTCTKLINYHAIEDSVVVMDKGSIISTKTTAYDAETGNAVVTQTANEFNDSIFNVNYPAYWAYSGMAPAYKNIDAVYTASFSDGRIVATGHHLIGDPIVIPKYGIESGDELYILNAGTSYTNSCSLEASPNTVYKVWAFNANKNYTALTDTAQDLVFMDATGKLFTKTGAQFRIIRSGHRNLLDANVGSLVMMSNPVITTSHGFHPGDTLKIISTAKVVSATAVEYKEKWQTDNDLFGKHVTLTDTATCTDTEITDCSGYLDKNINPYLKGLVGNFKPYQSKVFYGNRAETSVSPSSTDLRKNGYLGSFTMYWNFDNVTHNLIPDTANSKWVWNTHINKVNAKGLELETENALGIFSSAQYGFNKTMPVATANNAALSEIASDGFEDYGYNEALNKVTENPCAQQQIDFSLMNGTKVLNTDTADFNAHSGKNVLVVKKDSTAQLNIAVTKKLPKDFMMNLVKDTLRQLSDPGAYITPNGIIAHTPAPIFTNGNAGLNVHWAYNDPDDGTLPMDNYQDFFYNYHSIQYIKLATGGTYSFTLNSYQLYDHVLPINPVTSIIGSVSLAIRKLNDDPIFFHTINATSSPGDYSSTQSGTYSVYIPCGTYYIDCFVSTEVQLTSPMQIAHWFSSSSGYSSTLSTTTYQSLYPGNLCTFTRPIPATDSMLNPVYSIPAGKKMLFSAWVKEDCHNAVNTPCTKLSYDSNKVVMAYSTGGADTLRAIGNIIEGWQRYEGAFTAPAGATGVTLKFVNSSSGQIYFDDIRMQPFNANMKTYVYDPHTLKLSAELDENNYASFYEYDEEGQLVRVKQETIQGIKTIKETRSFKQKGITDVVQ